MSAVLTPDLCVIGAGSGGLTAAAAAARLGAEVVLIERGKMGGDCLNYGCVPSKSLLASARLATAWQRAAEHGIHYPPPQIDFAAVGDSLDRVIARIAPNDSADRFERLGVRVLHAQARFAEPGAVEAAGTTIRARRFVIATGSAPAVPAIPGIEAVPYLTNESVFANRELPKHLIVIGGGAIGIELGQAHRRLGAAVSVLDAGPMLPRDDPELAAMLLAQLAAEGISLRAEIAIARIEREADGIAVILGDGARLSGSHLLVAAGRRPNIAGLDLAAAGIAWNDGGIRVDDRLRTSNRRVFAIGDVAGGPQFTHVAAYHAGIAIRNALFRLPARVDYRALPWVTFGDPELAQVGLTETAARAGNHRNLDVLRWRFAENDRAHTERDTAGIVKIVARSNGHVLGATILGAGAGDLIQPWALAIARRLKISALANLVAPYPTRGEAGKRAAGSFYEPRLFSPHTRRLVRALAWLG
ncbi:MAG: FAD-dependent oxidoreductase [Alphaproteobacteria bacterium]|nr:FAD-dependent oxidoreductase [Alphaproteobacteria bacterium]MBV9862985.1 FAD-dependent oxidoreductase [Alphaproteobacteria bacterium]